MPELQIVDSGQEAFDADLKKIAALLGLQPEKPDAPYALALCTSDGDCYAFSSIVEALLARMVEAAGG